MGNVCARDETDKVNQDQRDAGHESDKMKPAMPQNSDSPVPKRGPPSPTTNAIPHTTYTQEEAKLEDSALATDYIKTTELNPMATNVKKAFEFSRPRDFKTFPELKEHYATPIEKIKNNLTASTYYGHVVRGVPHGWGLQISKKGEILEGVFENGHPKSHLRQITIDGHVYEGDMRDHRKEGRGIIYRPDGTSTFCQYWVNDYPTGTIEEKDQNGRIIFKGIRTDRGYEGPCVIGLKDALVECSFKDNMPSGNVIKRYNDGRLYEGLISKDLSEEGQGSLTFIDGRKFKGPFAKGVPHGDGMFTTDGGKELKQTWKNGKRVSAI